MELDYELYNADGKIGDLNGNIVLCTLKNVHELLIEEEYIKNYTLSWKNATSIEYDSYGKFILLIKNIV